MPRPAAFCPCASGMSYDACCGVFHARDKMPRSAEQLMRSRYSAYVVGDAEYLLYSWHPDTRPVVIDLDADRTWLGLRIIATVAGNALDATGIVEFTADFSNGSGESFQLHERSSFGRVDGRWTYVAGTAGEDSA